MFPSLFFSLFFSNPNKKALGWLWVRMSCSHTETCTECLGDERKISNQFWQCETAVLAQDICNRWGRSNNTNSADIILENVHISFVLYIHMNPKWCQLLHDLICKVEMWYRPTKSRMNAVSWIEFRLITLVNWIGQYTSEIDLGLMWSYQGGHMHLNIFIGRSSAAEI